MELSFSRADEIGQEQRKVSAELYNKICLLFSREGSDNLFVPIRSMQYLAVVDKEEIVFVDGQGPRAIEISWQNFRSCDRDNLREPVSFTCIYYDEKGREIMGRLQSEFLKVLQIMQERQPKSDGASVITLERN